jgi:predicted extracellular nuclease
MAEVENEKVIKDLINSEILKSRNYKYVHFDSPDRRGIDVALLYKNSVFKPFYQKAFDVGIKEDKNFRTRSILMVGGVIGKDSIYIYVNHWPSRRGGESETEDRRFAAAHKLKSLVDSLNLKHKNAKVIIMGDFNDDPISPSISNILQAGRDQQCKGEKLYDPFYELLHEGEGSLKFKHEWNSFDQIILSGSLIHSTHHNYLNNSAHVYHPLWMHYKENKSNGPFRTYQGLKYYGGYSDHFPVYVHLNDH